MGIRLIFPGQGRLPTAAIHAMAKRVLQPLLIALTLMAPAAAAPPAPTAAWPTPPKIAAPNWMLMDATTGQILAASNPDVPIAPASLTKLMTTYLTFSALRERKIRLDQSVASPAEAEIPQGARMFLLPGKNVSVNELLQGMITLGAHDAAIPSGSQLGATHLLVWVFLPLAYFFSIKFGPAAHKFCPTSQKGLALGPITLAVRPKVQSSVPILKPRVP